LLLDALVCGASLVAGLAASLFVPASVPLFALTFVTVAERFKLELAAFVFKLAALTGLLLLDRDFSTAFLSTTFDPPVLPTVVVAFFTAEGGATLFLATTVLTYLTGDLEADLPEVFALAAAAGAAFDATLTGATLAGTALTCATLAGETLALDLVTACSTFLVTGWAFFTSF